VSAPRVASLTLTLGVVTATLASPQQMSALTEGRWNLWSVALHKFALRPIWGNGYLSAQDSIYLSGGYHNEYLTALAEQGLIGFLAVAYLFWFLFMAAVLRVEELPAPFIMEWQWQKRKLFS